MKKLLIVSLLMGSIFQTSLGQIERPITKGNILTGGSLSINIDKNKNKDINPDVTYITDIKTFEADFILGYFLINHLAFGLKTDFYFSENKTTNSLNSSTWDYINNDFLIGPVIRYYTKPGIFLEGYTAIGFHHRDIKDDPVKWRNYSWSAGIGYSVFLTQSIAIEPVIKYRLLHKNAYKIEEGEEILKGLDFSIGFIIYLSLKKNNNENK